MLGPALFIIYIKDIDENASSSVPKLADDTKLYSNVTICDQTDCLQCDLDKMSEWSTKWQCHSMLISVNACMWGTVTLV